MTDQTNHPVPLNDPQQSPQRGGTRGLLFTLRQTRRS